MTFQTWTDRYGSRIWGSQDCTDRKNLWKETYGSPRLKWEETIKRASCCSSTKEDAGRYQGTGTSEDQDPNRVVAPLLKEEEKKIRIEQSTRRSRPLYTANCQVFACIPVFVHSALRRNCKLDLPVELDYPAGKTKPHSIWPCFWAVLWQEIIWRKSIEPGS